MYVYAGSDLVRAKAPDFGYTENPASPIPPTPHERWLDGACMAPGATVPTTA